MSDDERGTDQDEEKKTVPYDFPLKYPVKWGKNDPDVTTITIERRLKAKDIKGIHPSDIRFDDMLKLMSKMTGQSMAFIEELDSEDMIALTEVVNSFLGLGPVIGAD